MLIMMRTTLNIDDDLLRKAKHRAVDLNLSLSQLVDRALREALIQVDLPQPVPFAMVGHGPAGPPVHHEPEDFHDALGEDDEAGLGRD